MVWIIWIDFENLEEKINEIVEESLNRLWD